MEIAFKDKVKQSKTGKFPSNDNWLAQSILKRKFPSIDKPLRIEAPQKGSLKNISPGAYFRNFRVFCRRNGNFSSNTLILKHIFTKFTRRQQEEGTSWAILFFFLRLPSSDRPNFWAFSKKKKSNDVVTPFFT